MKQPSQEELLGYVLGALDATEQNQIQQLIDSDPALEESLIEIKNSLLPLEAIDTHIGPPVGLARRTCEMVSVSSKTSNPNMMTANADIGMSNNPPVQLTSSGLFAGTGSWSLMDFAVTCGVILVFAAILFPALAVSRYNSRIAACQSNLNSLGAAFLSFSEMNEGYFPAIPSDGNLGVAGSYAPQLKQVGLITDDSMFTCAGRGSNRETPVNIPTVDMVKSSKCQIQLRHYQKTMGGDFGSSLGHNENGTYRAACRMGRSNFVILADMPSCKNPQRVSENHDGRGQNVLFEDGHSDFVFGGAIGEDALFENNMGLVAPGADQFDSVIASSYIRPLVLTNSKR